jgi:hypothetical protein
MLAGRFGLSLSTSSAAARDAYVDFALAHAVSALPAFRLWGSRRSSNRARDTVFRPRV